MTTFCISKQTKTPASQAFPLRPATELGVSEADVPQQQLAWTRRFEGAGPTVSLDVLQPIGDFGLSAVLGGRGSLLFGEKNLSRFAYPASQTVPPLLRLQDADEVVGCGQLEVGIEWSRELARGGSWYVRGGYEGQLWAEAGAPTLTFLGFEGFNLTVGMAR